MCFTVPKLVELSSTIVSNFPSWYLASFPELSEKDFPNFDEFDLDADGTVSFAEWQRYLQQQKLKEAQKSQEEKGDGTYAQLLQQLYAKSHEDGTWEGAQRDTKRVGGRR